MLLTRSIQRKLWIGFALAAGVGCIEGGSSVMGLRSYRRMVDDLSLSITNLPRRSDLAASISRLVPVASKEIPGEGLEMSRRQEFARHQYDEFQAVFGVVRGEVHEFEANWRRMNDRLRPTPALESAYNALLVTIDTELDKLEQGAERLADPRSQRDQARALQRGVTLLLSETQKAPDPASRLIERLQEARQDYQFHFRLVLASLCLTVGLLLLLTVWGYRLIIAPIKELLRGVKRIAGGEYDIRLDIDTQCEISALADEFNEMARRIHEDRQRKEQEIAERCKQLVNSERLAGAGFLASGVAHEINNPLSVIMNAAFGLEMRLDENALSLLEEADRADVREYLALIQSESERCERITKKLLDFSHGRGEERHNYDVTAIVDEVVSMVGHLSRYQDRRITVDRSEPLHAWVNAPEIKQVLLNLVANALDATSAGGRVDVKLRDRVDVIEVTIQDDGCGLTSEQMVHLFEPFYTTKDVGKGTGLGLSITHRIVRDHGGTLEASSAGAGQGAVFLVRLPKRAPRAQAA